MTIIRKDLIEDMFDNMKRNNWDVDGDLLWGYFFIDRDPVKLEKLADYLVSIGYSYVEIYPDEERALLWLHVEKIETHTIMSLDKRNKELHNLARDFEIQDYDGMDAGKVQ
jgi:hypothetical protein